MSYLWLALILLAAAGLRVYGIDWDQGNYFHPDERWLLMVTEGTSLPSSLAQALDPSRSTLNPFYDHQERHTVHFAYGSFPVYLLRAIGYLLSPGGSMEAELNNLRLIGRGLSTAFDLGTIILVFLLGKRLRSEKVGLLGASLTAFTVLHVQLSHFFTVDTILTFFVLLAVYLAFSVAQSGRRRYGIIMG
ncbi:MAG: glycosyltransferase family 39 protein, partial [Chloroflexi bacterium]|nr:glycosyltransferase family 39 protein [Chloroflexota bacterium]